jgi:hypothetical protein
VTVVEKVLLTQQVRDLQSIVVPVKLIFMESVSQIAVHDVLFHINTINVGGVGVFKNERL